MSCQSFGAIAPNLTILDPFNAQADPSLIHLKAAIDPEQVLHQFQQLQNQPSSATVRFNPRQLQRIWVCRHKPGRRCLIEYRWIDPEAPGWTYNVLGKMRAKGLDQRSYAMQQTLWLSGFDEYSSDGVSVPEPLGLMPDWNQWLQRRVVAGQEVTDLLPGPDGLSLAAKIAQALHKLHNHPQHGPSWPQLRRHVLSDELKILHQQLDNLQVRHPGWNKRIQSLWEQCQYLSNRLENNEDSGPLRLIHRDFYPDQLLWAGKRLYLLDLDLACLGDPALDVGNFLGHLTEQGLRTLGSSLALKTVGDRLVQRFLERQRSDLSVPQIKALQQRIAIYTSLTLVRHIAISDRIRTRQLFTGHLLELCEQRLAEQLLVPRSRDRWDIGLASN